MPFRFPVPQSQDDNAATDARVLAYDPLLAPGFLRHELPASPAAQNTIRQARVDVAKVVRGDDPRLLVVVGPCSIHDVDEALEYAEKLRQEIQQNRWSDLLIVMRTYFEKPRTTVGWKGLINDPDLDGTFQINKGLRIARKLLVDLADKGIPSAGELLDTIGPQYVNDLLSWGAIGARTTESQLHRELSSGVSFPVGFKNSTDGSTSIALDAMLSASHPHAFMGVTETGQAAIVKTRGNEDGHVILRGGKSGTNYKSEHIDNVSKQLGTRGWEKGRIMVDCSHGNSEKNYLNQPKVLADVASQIAQGESRIIGVMIESNLNAGRQDVPASGDDLRSALKKGVSITDACVDWEMTLGMLDSLSDAVKKRRELAA